MEIFKLKCKKINTNYEFDNEKYFSNTVKYAEYIIYSEKLFNINLYFINIDENTYYEIISQRIFKRNLENGEILVNEQTGIYFNVNDFVKINDSKILLKNLKNYLYKFYVKDFLNVCEELNHKDNELRTKVFNLCLKNNKRYKL